MSRRHYAVRALQDTTPEAAAITTVSDLVTSDLPQDESGLRVQVDGWVRNIRKSSAVRFVDVSDGSTTLPMQAVVKKDQAKE